MFCKAMIFRSLLLSLFLFACTKEDRELQIAQQIKEIDLFTKPFVTNGKRLIINSGSNRVVIDEGVGDTLALGDSVFFDFGGYIFQSRVGTLFETNIQSIAETFGINIYNRGFDYGKGIVGKGLFVNGLDKGLMGTKKGEHSFIVFPADMGFGNKDVGLVPRMTPLIYEVWIKEIKKN